MDTMPISKEEEVLSEYEQERIRNIKEFQDQFRDIFDVVKTSAKTLATSLPNDKKQSATKQIFRPSSNIKTTSVHQSSVRRSLRIVNEKKSESTVNEVIEKKDSKFKKQQVTNSFKFHKKIEVLKRNAEYHNSLADSVIKNQENCEPRSKRIRNTSSATVPRLPVSQVNQQMLQNISYSSYGKQYSSEGTTCHQCRQKTLDQKSYCRYIHCKGYRGMFCGFCLGKRYGEDVAEVLLNPKWACPPCRGLCNCSICRRKVGMEPTGTLVPHMSVSGFQSVSDMLTSIEGQQISKVFCTKTDLSIANRSNGIEK
ncbi:uncharacterized protein LOC126836534 [Adelges cooleyi]|uniref:uncharacterized protein LOC126836534 n=1 Tax=Adelges cooleyi TaxID=133065 RepID=UPI00218038F6|nr:uncharacterized protein LOC126836534 [Adelges cooleyi]